MNWKLRTASIAGTLLVLVSGTLAQDTPAPKLVLSMDKWDFGEVWHPQLQQTNLTIKNEGNADLLLTRVKAC